MPKPLYGKIQYYIQYLSHLDKVTWSVAMIFVVKTAKNKCNLAIHL